MSALLNLCFHGFGFGAGQGRKDPAAVVVRFLGGQIPCGLGQFAGQRFGRDDVAGPGGFAVIPLAARFIIPLGEVGRFHKGPGQIFIATFAIVFPFELPVGGAVSGHRAAVTGKVAGTGKAFDVSHLHGDGQAQDDPHTRQGLEFGIAGQLPRHTQDGLFQLLDARVQ
ncbi:MAG: hypothetical protein JWQ71_4156 [Pedosphaera sp.]|nr:hypothetical protein [Pedosphaera sp.]